MDFLRVKYVFELLCTLIKHSVLFYAGLFRCGIFFGGTFNVFKAKDIQYYLT